MGKRQQICVHPDCTEARSKYTPRRLCQSHDIEADIAEAQEYRDDPRRDVESALSDCDSLEDLKTFIADHILKS